MSDALAVKGPYTDGTYSVVQRGQDGKLHGRGFFRSRWLAEERLEQLRRERARAI